MKIRRSVFCFITIATVLITLALWYGKKQQVKVPPTIAVETNGVPPAATVSEKPESAPSSPVMPLATAVNTTAPIATNKGEQIKEGLASLNDVPIAFYGRLEDQFGNPVVGAQIAASIRIYSGMQSTVEHSSVNSDANGFFQVKGGKGEGLGLWPRKDGYALATRDTYFKYSYMYADHFTPDPNNPTVIKMWKLQGAEPLVSLDKIYKLHCTDAPIYFDLLAGKVVPVGGDLKIMINRPAGEVSEHNPQKWSVDFEVVNGGFIETSDKEWGITYAAPDNGYQTNGTFGNNNGIGALDKAFFIQSRNGQIYGKLGFSVGINNEPDDLMYIRFSGFANTNGSRNWEATIPGQ
jgi:hypothetical protein